MCVKRIETMDTCIMSIGLIVTKRDAINTFKMIGSAGKKQEISALKTEAFSYNSTRNQNFKILEEIF